MYTVSHDLTNTTHTDNAQFLSADLRTVSSCLLDGPHQVPQADVARAKEELDDMFKESMRSKERARAEARRRRQEQQEQREARAEAEAQRRWEEQERFWKEFLGHLFSAAGGQRSSNDEKSSPKTKNGSGGIPVSKNLAIEECHYTALGVSSRATVKEIKQACRTLALKYHPDKNQTDEAGVITRRLNEANRALRDSDSRAKYDRDDSGFRHSYQLISSSLSLLTTALSLVHL